MAAGVVFAVAGDVLGQGNGRGSHRDEVDDDGVFVEPDLHVVAVAGDVLDVDGACVLDSVAVVIHPKGYHFAVVVVVDGQLCRGILVTQVRFVLQEYGTPTFVTDKAGELHVIPIVISGDEITVDLGIREDKIPVLISCVW